MYRSIYTSIYASIYTSNKKNTHNDPSSRGIKCSIPKNSGLKSIQITEEEYANKDNTVKANKIQLNLESELISLFRRY